MQIDNLCRRHHLGLLAVLVVLMEAVQLARQSKEGQQLSAMSGVLCGQCKALLDLVQGLIERNYQARLTSADQGSLRPVKHL